MTQATAAAPAEAPVSRGVPLLELRGVTRVYSTGRLEVPALRGVDVDVWPGEFVAIVGHSGSGKTTLMNIIGCLDRPTEGTVKIAGHDIAGLDDNQLTSLRSQAIGFVFQQFQLLPQTTAVDNVAAPLLYQGVKQKEARRRATEVLTRLGLGDRLTHDRGMLSGGQQQRVAIARAVVTSPALLLADEPTGALDTHSSAEVLTLFDDLAARGGTVVMITHEDDVARHAKRILGFSDGRIVSDVRQVPLEAPPPRWKGVTV